MKHCKDNDSNITSVLNVSGIRKEKDQRNLFKFSCLLVYFCRIWIDLYLMISKRQNWDLVLKTLIWQHLRNLQFSLKERKIKSISHEPVLDFWRAFSASRQTSHCPLLCSRLLNICIWKESWLDKTSRKKSKLSILISFSCCALCPSGSCVLDHLKVLTINCNLASNFYLLSPLCFLFVAV